VLDTSFSYTVTMQEVVASLLEQRSAIFSLQPSIIRLKWSGHRGLISEPRASLRIVIGDLTCMRLAYCAPRATTTTHVPQPYGLAHRLLPSSSTAPTEPEHYIRALHCLSPAFIYLPTASHTNLKHEGSVDVRHGTSVTKRVCCSPCQPL
jgi:hypothetical protein